VEGTNIRSLTTPNKQSSPIHNKTSKQSEMRGSYGCEEVDGSCPGCEACDRVRELEAVRSSQTVLSTYKTARRHNTEDYHRHSSTLRGPAFCILQSGILHTTLRYNLKYKLGSNSFKHTQLQISTKPVYSQDQSYGRGKKKIETGVSTAIKHN
jgi:hypothetical protein